MLLLHTFEPGAGGGDIKRGRGGIILAGSRGVNFSRRVILIVCERMNRRSVAPTKQRSNETGRAERKCSIFDVLAVAAAGGGNNQGREGRRRCGYLLRSRVSAQQTCICRVCTKYHPIVSGIASLLPIASPPIRRIAADMPDQAGGEGYLAGAAAFVGYDWTDKGRPAFSRYSMRKSVA
ncbi:hypothetical protein CIRG_03216 [Coccidioides immitis RMSCC 2394]|uniref:Uncharacterized protein n=1 Tax=Coccidioides immitis RMSCC 2394 TaxID=404692 RepID=A0A0J6Y932_COCIT|nr:hypothetical protein CIRG_03216 [Coccidioides immitis RMSCC 2394]